MLLVAPRRTIARKLPAMPPNGGLVVVTATDRWRTQTDLSTAWAKNNDWAKSRTTIDVFPKLENGNLWTSTPFRRSREGKRMPGSSQPLLDVYTITRQPRRAISSAASTICWPTAIASGT